MHRRPLGNGRRLALLGAVILLVGCVLPWYSVGGDGGLPQIVLRAFDGTGIVSFFAALATLALVALPYAAGERPVSIDRGISYAILAAAVSGSGPASEPGTAPGPSGSRGATSTTNSPAGHAATPVAGRGGVPVRLYSVATPGSGSSRCTDRETGVAWPALMRQARTRCAGPPGRSRPASSEVAGEQAPIASTSGLSIVTGRIDGSSGPSARTALAGIQLRTVQVPR
jgi:hypothetical protein